MLLNIMTAGIGVASLVAVASNIWIDRVADEMFSEIRLAAEDPKPGEPVNVTHLRTWMAENWDRLLKEASESSHPKGNQSGTGVLRTELKPGISTDDLNSEETDRSNKGDRLAGTLEGYSFACKEGACERKDTIRFRIVPRDSPKAVPGSFD